MLNPTKLVIKPKSTDVNGLDLPEDFCLEERTQHAASAGARSRGPDRNGRKAPSEGEKSSPVPAAAPPRTTCCAAGWQMRGKLHGSEARPLSVPSVAKMLMQTHVCECIDRIAQERKCNSGSKRKNTFRLRSVQIGSNCMIHW